jgi:ParB family transcriptional regulator, chromosome partitioning protein
MADKNKLKEIPIDQIVPNPDNPRIVFRQEEMDQLLVSIKKYGVQVPVTVFQDRNKFVLIDGERRWRTSKKLNLKTIPAIIQAKPSELENLLMMFNIHSLREQWDLFTIANKITKVINLLEGKLGRTPNEVELSEETGLNRSTIRRCKLLIELPQRFKDVILNELDKPKSKQAMTEDFFIEMEAALKTVKNNIPSAIPNIDRVRDNLIRKYQKGVIKNIVDFRQVAKLATSPKNVQYNAEKAQKALSAIFENNDKGIEEVYNSTVGVLYDEKKLLSTFSNTIYYIESLTQEEQNDPEIVDTLRRLRKAIDKIIGKA